jgi:hypothetical protein
MAFDVNAIWLSTTAITHATTATVTAVGSAKDVGGGGPRRGYDLTCRVASVFATVASLATSAVTYTFVAQAADDTAFSTNLIQYNFEPFVLNYVNGSTTASNVTAGFRQTHRFAPDNKRYIRVYCAVGVGGTAVVDSIIEAVVGQSTPA